MRVCLCAGLLDEHTLRRCQKVSQSWQHLAKETKEEIKFRGNFQHQVEAMMKVGHLCVHSGMIQNRNYTICFILLLCLLEVQRY